LILNSQQAVHYHCHYRKINAARTHANFLACPPPLRKKLMPLS